MHLEIFHRRSGRHVGSRPYDGNIGRVAVGDSTAWLGNLNSDRNTSLVLWRPGTHGLEYALSLPRPYRHSSPLRGIYPSFSVALRGDTILVGYHGINRLDVLDRSLEWQESIRIPVELRLGQPDGLVRKLEQLPFPEKFSLLSGLFTMGRLPEGKFALVHYDQTLTSLSARQVEVEAYLSLLSADLDRACVDRSIPVAQANQPRMALKGDSLFVLQQEILEHGDRARTFVEIYEISAQGCSWEPVHHGEQP